ncbi:hypothetical protein [Devosia nitrariae]|uniref:DUF1127 domain-containing protein n=1 Tax=Devosia nitrariae TaxID=2071872 RepID=A0ABQ5WB29_9HYPH|nr:hypothetical protein [Devosia nitrariae]GLQ57162.1 hypothetical protein GCM10010862_44210 [Devosia nitrariae]
MLYRQRRSSAASILRAVLARLVGLVAELHRTGTDTAYLDRLSDHSLRDIGVRRIATRDDIVYR